MAKDFVQLHFVGDVETRNRLRELPVRAQRNVVRRSLSAGATVMVRAIRRAAPRGPTGNLKRSIGKSIKVKGGKITVAKVGIDVGKKRLFRVVNAGRSRFGRQGAHGHLVALGSKRRFKKSGQSTGKMPRNPFVRQAAAASEPAAIERMRVTAIAGYRREWKKLKARGAVN